MVGSRYKTYSLFLLQQYRVSSDTALYLGRFKYLTTLNTDLQFFCARRSAILATKLHIVYGSHIPQNFTTLAIEIVITNLIYTNTVDSVKARSDWPFKLRISFAIHCRATRAGLHQKIFLSLQEQARLNHLFGLYYLYYLTVLVCGNTTIPSMLVTNLHDKFSSF